MRDVFVAGTGLVKFGELWDKGLREIGVEAVLKALEDAKVDLKEVDAFYVGTMSSGRFAGQEHCGALITGELGINVPSMRVEGACASGGLAFREAYLSILSGKFDVVVALGMEKMTDLTTEEVTLTLSAAADQEWESYYGVTFPGLYALMARRHMHEYGTKREQMAMVAVKNHENAALNPFAQFRNKITVEDVLNSTPVADPLNLLDCSPITDGAAAVVLTTKEFAERNGKALVKVSGSGLATDSLALHNRESLTGIKAAKIAAKKAYEESNFSPGKIDVAEVHDCFTIAEIMAYEDLGFVEKGKGGKFIEDGETKINGSIPVNTSGGLKACGHPVGATGIKQVCEIVMQLRGEAGERQVKDARVGLTHNVGGSGATCVVNILERL